VTKNEKAGIKVGVKKIDYLKKGNLLHEVENQWEGMARLRAASSLPRVLDQVMVSSHSRKFPIIRTRERKKTIFSNGEKGRHADKQLTTRVNTIRKKESRMKSRGG